VWFKITSYINFLINSTNQHGVHSPFVYNLVTKCFYKKTTSLKKTAYLNYKKKLANNKNQIEVNDLGEGSKVFKSNKRKISKIAKVAGISNKRAFLLIRLVEYFKPNTVLELGTSLGLATAAMHLGDKASKIYSIEGCKNTANVAASTLKKVGFSNIEIINNNFSEALPKLTKNKKLDFIYIDGNHKKEATISYFNQCLKATHNNSIIIFDDIYWSKQMQLAWQHIINNPKVTVSIDTYKWGIVFFRKEQAKEHFTIRI